MADTRGAPPNEGDVVINGGRYVLARDPRSGMLQWSPSMSVGTQQGDAKQFAHYVLDRGTPGGMGETFQTSPDSLGYAFSTLDASNYGFWRLPGRRVTKATATVDAPTWFDEAKAAGNAQFHVVTVAKDATVGTVAQVVTHGAGFTPKAIYAWTGGGVASGTVAAGGRACIGITDGTNSRAASWNSEDNVADSNCATRYGSKFLILTGPTHTTTTVPECTISAIGGTTFTLNWTNNDATQEQLHFLCIGGSDVSASVKEWAGTATSVTGVGFEPDFGINICTSLTAAGTAAGVSIAMGAFDSFGNQWSNAVTATDASAASDAADVTSVGSFNSLISGASFLGMTGDGFNMTAGTGSELNATLLIKGVQARIGTVLAKSSTGSQAAVTLPFTTTAFVVSSVGDFTLESIGVGGVEAIMAIGAASATGEVAASCWTDETAAATMDTYSVDDSALAMEILTPATGAESSLATCGNINMGTAGWLEWSATGHGSAYIGYIALAPLVNSEEDSFVYCHQGQYTKKLSVASNVITIQETKDHGSGASIGSPAKFGTGGTLYLPLGAGQAFQRRTVVAASGGTDSWDDDDSGDTALSFATIQDGSTPRLARASSTNEVSLSADGITFASAFQVGDKSTAITNMADSGTQTIVFKADGNAYQFDPTGTARAISNESRFINDPDNGVGGIVIDGTNATIWNNLAGLQFAGGDQLPQRIGPDALETNKEIPNVAYEPHRGRHYETVARGEWVWSLYRVTESGVTKTYLLAMRKVGPGQFILHSYTRFDGVARGLYIDSKSRLWWTSEGVVGYHRIGNDGSPDAGRDAIGYGAASTDYDFITPTISFDNAAALVQQAELTWLLNGADATLKVYALIDQGAAAQIGSTISTTGAQRAYTGTSPTSGTRFQFLVRISTGSSYVNTSNTAHPVIYHQAFRLMLQPLVQDGLRFVVRTRGTYGNENEQVHDAKKIRDDLRALVRNATTGAAVGPVLCTDPDGNDLYLKIVDVADAAVVYEGDTVHYEIAVDAVEYRTAAAQ